MITFEQKGDFSKTNTFLQRMMRVTKSSDLDRFGQAGVQALRDATPKDTGKTAASWDYQITTSKEKIEISWTNSNIQNGVNIAVLLQYGHGTGWGGYVKGVDYINPALKPIFEDILQNVWGEVSRK